MQHHLLKISVAQGKGVVEPDTVTDDFALGIGNGSTWTSSRKLIGTITSILLPPQVDNTVAHR